MRVLFLTQWFDPEPTFKGLAFAKALQAKGYEVEVATGFPNYPSGKVYPGYKIRPWKSEIVSGIHVTRLPLFPSHSRSTIGRILNYCSFFFSSLIFGLLRAGKFDVVYVYHPPITVGCSAALFGKARRVPFVIDVLDLWPDSVAASGMGNKFLVSALGRVCDFVYRNAAAITVPSQGLRTKLVERGVPHQKISLIYNWADETRAVARRQTDLSQFEMSGKFNIVYGGNIGPLQALEFVVEAAEKAAIAVPNLQLILIGDGIERDRLRQLVKKTGACHVKIHDSIPQAYIGDVFDAADVLLVHLADDPLFSITIPSKTQFYMAMAKPILAGLAGEGAELVTSARAGLTSPPGNVDELARAMVSFARMNPDVLGQMGKNGRDYYLAHMSFELAIDKTIALLLQGSGASLDHSVKFDC